MAKDMNEPAILKDTFNRFHNYLRISLTEKCNLRCTYCMPEEGIILRDKSHFMTFEEILEITQIFVDLGVSKVRLTGGEPLVRRNVNLLIERLSKLPINLSLTTNAILLHKHFKALKKSGINNLNISLDTLKADKFLKITRRNKFDLVLKNINTSLQKGFTIKLNVVLIKGFNDDEIIDFIKLTEFKNISIRFIEFMPFDGNEWDKAKVVSFEDIIQLSKSYFGSEKIQVLPIIENDTSKNFKIKGFAGNFGIISTVTNPFCDSCNRIRLTADGKLKNCLFSNKEVDLLTALRDGEDLKSLIQQSIHSKKKARAGMERMDQFIDPDLNQNNRSMISIGG